MKGWLWAVGVLGVLLFVGGPDGHDKRIYQTFWDLGHVPLFAILTVAVCRLPVCARLSVPVLAVVCTLLVLAGGFAIEWAQLLVGRSFEYADVLSDLLGSYIGLSLYLALKPVMRPAGRAVLVILAMLLVLVSLKPMAVVLADEYVMREEFPVLADFETPFELTRWDTNLAQLHVSREPVRYGEKSLRVDFMAGEYPDITLRDFPGDWSGFKSVRFSVYSTLASPAEMVLKIYDRQHASSGYEYADRFNRELNIDPGWNDIEVRMDDVSDAPEGRNMDLENITSFSLFMERLEQPAVFYVDALRLSSK